MLTFGVCSDIDRRKDFLIWDFDAVSLEAAKRALEVAQKIYGLPHIYVLETTPGRYSAVCFAEKTTLEAAEIIGETSYIDDRFLNLAKRCGYFTLRIGPKNGYEPKLVCVIKDSSLPFSIQLQQIKHFVMYEITDYYKTEISDVHISDVAIIEKLRGKLLEMTVYSKLT